MLFCYVLWVVLTEGRSFECRKLFWKQEAGVKSGRNVFLTAWDEEDSKMLLFQVIVIYKRLEIRDATFKKVVTYIDCQKDVQWRILIRILNPDLRWYLTHSSFLIKHFSNHSKNEINNNFFCIKELAYRARLKASEIYILAQRGWL